MTAAQKLWEKVMAQAERDEEHRWRKDRQEIIRLNVQPPDTKAEQSRKTLLHLRARRAEIEYELKLRAQVELEQERFCKAERALRLVNLTMAERKAQEEETRAFQIRLSHIISPEHHPDWKAMATVEFQSKGRK